MSYDTLKNHFKTRISGLGYSESKSSFNFQDAPSTEYDRSFIVMPVAGSIDPDGANLNISIFDTQQWIVQIPFKKSAHNDIVQRDDMLRSVEAIIKDLDNPSNYSSSITLIRYQSWEVTEEADYYLLTITFEVRDEYTY